MLNPPLLFHVPGITTLRFTGNHENSNIATHEYERNQFKIDLCSDNPITAQNEQNVQMEQKELIIEQINDQINESDMHKNEHSDVKNDPEINLNIHLVHQQNEKCTTIQGVDTCLSPNVNHSRNPESCLVRQNIPQSGNLNFHQRTIESIVNSDEHLHTSIEGKEVDQVAKAKEETETNVINHAISGTNTSLDLEVEMEKNMESISDDDFSQLVNNNPTSIEFQNEQAIETNQREKINRNNGKHLKDNLTEQEIIAYLKRNNCIILDDINVYMKSFLSQEAAQDTDSLSSITIYVAFPPLTSIDDEFFYDKMLNILHIYQQFHTKNYTKNIQFHFLNKNWLLDGMQNNRFDTSEESLSIYKWTEAQLDQGSPTKILKGNDTGNICGRRSVTRYNLRPKTRGYYAKLRADGIPIEDEFHRPQADVDNSTLLCKWKNIYLTEGDYNRLEPFQFLNDNVIDMARERMTIPDNCYVYNTFFYKLLERNIDRVSKTIPNKNIRIFDKDFLFIPINRNVHWSLIVVCLKGVTHWKKATKAQENVAKRRNKVVIQKNTTVSGDSFPGSNEIQEVEELEKVGCTSEINDQDVGDSSELASSKLDSLQNERVIICDNQRAIIGCDSMRFVNSLQGAMSKVRQYLSLRWDLENGNTTSSTTFTSADFKGSYASLPLQDNDCDCGVFVVRYMEELLKNPPTEIPFQRENLFSQNSISECRKDLQSFMKEIASEYKEKNENTCQDEDTDDDLEVVCVISPNQKPKPPSSPAVSLNISTMQDKNSSIPVAKVTSQINQPLKQAENVEIDRLASQDVKQILDTSNEQIIVNRLRNRQRSRENDICYTEHEHKRRKIT